MFHTDTPRPSTFPSRRHRSYRAIRYPANLGRERMQLKDDDARGEGAVLHAPPLELGSRSFSGCRMAARR